MFVRIYRARVIPGQEERFLAFLRDDAMPWLRQAGAIATYFGRRFGERGEDFVAISVWAGIRELEAAVPNWREPIAFPQARDMLADDTVEHYETVSEERPGA